MTKTTSTTLWDDMAPVEDAPRLPRSTRGAWRAPASASRRAPARPRQTGLSDEAGLPDQAELPGLAKFVGLAKLPGLAEASVADDGTEDSAAPRRVARRRSVPRATAGADVREYAAGRRGLMPRSRAGWIGLTVAAALLLGMMAAAGVLLRRYLLQDVHFSLGGSQEVRSLVTARGDAAQVTRAEILSVFGQDIGRNIFFVPLSERRRELEAIPWVRQATVMRVLPDRLYVKIAERTPIAFARVGDTVELVDADGVLLPMTPSRMALHSYSFPVVTGLNVHPAMATAEERMALYQRFLADLDRVQPHASAQVSEIDLSDPDDLRATLSDGGADMLVHFGAEDFAARYAMYRAHIAEWHARYPNLTGMDLRFAGNVPLQLASQTANAAGGAAKPTSPAATGAGAAANASSVAKPQAVASQTEAPQKAAAPMSALPKARAGGSGHAAGQGTGHAAAKHASAKHSSGSRQKAGARRVKLASRQTAAAERRRMRLAAERRQAARHSPPSAPTTTTGTGGAQ